MAGRNSQGAVRDYGTYDYIVVGGGTAGCVLANRLSADPSVTVLLLEAGGRDDYFWIHVPIGYLYTMHNPRTDWCLKTEPEPGLDGRALAYPRGKVLGGCSSINGMIYMRGQARDYDGWRQMGNTGWAWDDVLPYFKRSEDHHGGANAVHGAGGEWRVEQQRLHWPILDAFRDAAEEVGIPKTGDFNTGDNEGSGYFEVNQRRGVRWSTAKAFLKPVMHRHHLRVLTGARASRLLLREGAAEGILFDYQGETCRACADGEILLTAGAVHSPQLLELSGIGRPDVLHETGIELVHELTGVGENLQDHLQVRAVFKIRRGRTLNEQASSIVGKLKMGLDYAIFRRGPLSMAPSQLGLFAKSDPAKETPDLQYHIQPLSTDRLGGPLHSFKAITASVCNLRPQSRGDVHIAGPDHEEAPRIRPRYLSTAEDRLTAAKALRLTRRIMQTKAVAVYEPEEFLPGPHLASDEELAVAAGQIATTIFHPVGTCRMGTDSEAVVDPELRVRGIAKLRVVDASVMPTITSGNTNSPVIMIAEKAADMIITDRKK